MNYQAHYNKLMQRAQDRILIGYTETHHIIPRCMGGDNSRENLAVLTPEEHYIAHQLLVKMFPGNHKLLWAAVAMTNSTKKMPRHNKLHGWLRRRFAEAMSQKHKGRKHTAEARAKMSKAQLGKKRNPHNEETKLKMSLIATGRKKSAEHVENLRIAKTGKKIKPCSEERKERIRQSNIEACKHRTYDERQTAEYKARQAEKMKEIWRKRHEGELPMRRSRKPHI